MPEQEDGRMEGFQLRLNLAAQDKMQPAGYRDIPSGEIPELSIPGVTARVIAGASHGVPGAMSRERTDPLILDIHLDARAVFEQTLPVTHNAFVYVYRVRSGSSIAWSRASAWRSSPTRRPATAWCCARSMRQPARC